MKGLITSLILLATTLVFAQKEMIIHTSKVCMTENEVYYPNNNTFKFNYNNSSDLAITWQNGSTEVFKKDKTKATQLGRTSAGYETITNIYISEFNSITYMVQVIISPNPLIITSPLDKDYMIFYK